MTTSTATSSMARGSPARIVIPKVAARTLIHPSLDDSLRCCASCRTARSWSGTHDIPATRPMWPTCADIAPAKANDRAPTKLAAGCQPETAQEAEHADGSHYPRQDEVERPGRDSGQDGEEQRRRVGGPCIPVTEQRGSAPDVGIEQRQVAARDLAAHEDAQREVLRQVVTGDDGVPEQRRQPENQNGKNGEDRDGDGVLAP